MFYRLPLAHQHIVGGKELSRGLLAGTAVGLALSTVISTATGSMAEPARAAESADIVAPATIVVIAGHVLLGADMASEEHAAKFILGQVRYRAVAQPLAMGHAPGDMLAANARRGPQSSRGRARPQFALAPPAMKDILDKLEERRGRSRAVNASSFGHQCFPNGFFPSHPYGNSFGNAKAGARQPYKKLAQVVIGDERAASELA